MRLLGAVRRSSLMSSGVVNAARIARSATTHAFGKSRCLANASTSENNSPFELMSLNVWKHLPPVPPTTDPPGDLAPQVCLQFVYSPRSLAAKAIEVDQRGHDVETVVEERHVGAKPLDRDVASLAGRAGPAHHDRPNLDAHRSQVRSQHTVGELPLGWALRTYGQAGHGFPPRRFFCHSSPDVKPSSSQRWYCSESSLRRLVLPPSKSATTISLQSNESTSNGDCVATMT